MRQLRTPKRPEPPGYPPHILKLVAEANELAEKLREKRREIDEALLADIHRNLEVKAGDIVLHSAPSTRSNRYLVTKVIMTKYSPKPHVCGYRIEPDGFCDMIERKLYGNWKREGEDG